MNNHIKTCCRSRGYRHGWLYVIVAVLLVPVSACAPQPERTSTEPPSAAEGKMEEAMTRSREAMVRVLRGYYGIKDEKVLAAMSRVPRHRFVPEENRALAYADRPLEIGEGQTISQPFIVAFMTECLSLSAGDRVLEIGTGSGYQAAILAEMVDEVYTIEILEPLARRAENTLKELGYDGIAVKVGDGYRGWKEHAPFDAIIVTCAPDHVPQALVEQLAVGGRMIIPVGEWDQELVLITKTEQGIVEEKKIPVLFVPMTGEAER